MKNFLKMPLIRRSLYFLAGFIVFILLMNNVIMPWYVSSPEKTVPKVTGIDISQAEKNLDDSDLVAIIADTTYDESVPRGHIILQKPNAGEKVKVGRRVYLFVSGGDPIVAVPDLKGKSVRDAKFALERLGLSLGQIEDVPSNNPKDMIFDQQYAPGTKLQRGASVSVTMSVGNNQGFLTVPDLMGKSLVEAQKVLTDSGLNVGKINYQSSYSLLPNTVVDQYPSKGSKVNPGTKVDLFVTKNVDNPNK